MLRRIAIAAATTAAAAAAVGYLVIGQAGAASTFGNTFTVTETVGVIIDEATHKPPDLSKPIPPGDTLAFKADLLQGSTKVGYTRGECTAAFGTKFVCNVIFVISNHGSLGLQVLFDLAHPEGDYVVTGGTGQFAGQHGWGHFKTLSNGEEIHTIHLTS